MNNELKPEEIQEIEKNINWILPGCQLFYRDTDADIDVEKSYPIGSIIRAVFLLMSQQELPSQQKEYDTLLVQLIV
mgnify:FL=1